MRSVYCKPLARDVSVLGFGCASLGSRIAPEEGLRALSAAYDRGVRWFDVAPPYGDGQAEALLGGFLKGRRDSAVICTKVGIARPQISARQKLLRSVLRPVVKALPSIRPLLARTRSSERLPIRADMIESSVMSSLRALGTDYIDVLALHEPTLQECRDPAILGILHKLKAEGHVRALSIAGAPESLSAGFDASSEFTFGQCPDSPFDGNLRRLKGRAAFLLSHSVFGSGTLERFTNLVTTSVAVKAALAAAGYDREGGIADALMDYAFASNGEGVVLASMYSPRHIAHNCERASLPANVALVDAIDAIIAKVAA